MSKNVYLDKDVYNRLYVREILPDAATPIEDWYNAEFATHCVEAPDNIKQNMLYDEKTKTFYDWVPLEDDTIFTEKSLSALMIETINRV